jgi:hypothetical protein
MSGVIIVLLIVIIGVSAGIAKPSSVGIDEAAAGTTVAVLAGLTLAAVGYDCYSSSSM